MNCNTHRPSVSYVKFSIVVATSIVAVLWCQGSIIAPSHETMSIGWNSNGNGNVHRFDCILQVWFEFTNLDTCMRCTCNDKINVVWAGMYPVVSDTYGLGGEGLFSSAAIFNTNNVFINKPMVHVRAPYSISGVKVQVLTNVRGSP